MALAKRIGFSQRAAVLTGPYRFCTRLWTSAIFAAAAVVAAEPAPPTLAQLAAENDALRAQVAAQQKLIEALQARMDAWDQKGAPASPAPVSANPPAESASAPAGPPAVEAGATVRLSAEVGLAYFQTGSEGAYPTGEFRVDEARIYLEAPVIGNVFFHGEFDLMTREASDSNTHLGEVYADSEDLPGPWGGRGALNLRVGRINIPFGEEYQYRNALENPLVQHSLSDIWGFDAGIEAYGSAGGWSYAAAVLDGSVNPLNNTHSSKSAAVRVGYDPGPFWGFSLSGMTTGRVSSQDTLSAVWIGNGFFVGLPGAHQFWAQMGEADLHAAWRGGHVRAALGQARYADNHPGGGLSRHLGYGYIEAVQNVADQLYVALRYSQISVPGGYPLVGNAPFGEYEFGGVLTSKLQRVSLGGGYRFSDALLLKIDYSPEWGDTVNDGDRDHEQFFATELALKF